MSSEPKTLTEIISNTWSQEEQEKLLEVMNRLPDYIFKDDKITSLKDFLMFLSALGFCNPVLVIHTLAEELKAMAYSSDSKPRPVLDYEERVKVVILKILQVISVHSSGLAEMVEEDLERHFKGGEEWN